MRALSVNHVRIDDTFAEAFPMRATGVVITADSAQWARQAAVTMTGFATSVIGCGCEAGIDRARMVIAAREDDGENAFIALVAKDLNPKVRLLAVASSALAIRRLKLARADLVFSPAAVGSRLLADLVEGNEISPAFRDLLQGGLQEG